MFGNFGLRKTGSFSKNRAISGLIPQNKSADWDLQWNLDPPPLEQEQRVLLKV